MVEPLTLALRGLVAGLLVAALLAGGRLPRRARGALWPLLLCLAAYIVRAAPQARGWPGALLLPLTIGSLLFPLAFWWLVQNVFDDRTDVPLPVWLGAAVLLAAGLARSPPGVDAAAVGAAGAHVLQKAVASSFMLAGLWRLWRSAGDDLVAGRRRLRGWLLAYIGIHTLAVLGAELWLRGRAAPAWLDAANVTVIGLAIGVTLALLLGFRSEAIDLLFGRETSAAPSPLPAPVPVQGDADAPATARLQRLMEVERVYRDAELSVGRLAERAGLPEYRLRELIHQRLGFRNFAAYVNEHRLREVEQQLVNPELDRRPILTLALEAGFGSIGPFNRAFRERHGVTPSAFRSRRGALAPLGGGQD